ncbi:MAG: crossover junction endodeoxyribonuclease RuvC [Bacteroidales bacterium]|nr:crossover junction endodeoxyribonuclease RuvC [Bacteroidales bacterium]
MNTTKGALDEHIILGIDPGTNVLGYGLLSVQGRKAKMLAMGVIDLRRVNDVYLRLGRIYERVMGIIDAFHPDELAIEAPFYGKNVQSMLKLGRAQGVVIAAAMARQIPICEYTPMQIKQAATGSGASSKEQVAALLQRMLNIPDDNMLPYLDATDALGAAYCHYLSYYRRGVKGALPMGLVEKKASKTTSRSWAEFARSNAGRVRQ